MKCNNGRIVRAVVCLALGVAWAFPIPAIAEVGRAVLRVTVTSGSLSSFTSDTTLFSRKVSFQADNGNTGVIYIGDSTLDATSTTTLKNTCFASLSAGSGWTPGVSFFSDGRGEQYQLSDFRTTGATTNDIVRMTYEVRR